MKAGRHLSRRGFLLRSAGAAAFFTCPGAFADALLRQTPWVGKGPLYPDVLPLDKDNDLIVVNDSLTAAIGEITHVSGRILGPDGEPIRDAVVEIWQADQKAVYLTERSGKAPGSFDPNFQGFGRFQTGSSGAYRFRTIKPVAYPGRVAPHIHFMIKVPGRDPWTTQLYVKGHPGNARDEIYRSIGDAAARELVTVDFAPLEQSKVGELGATFDIVLGLTPEA